MIFKSIAGKAPPASGLLPALALSCVLHVLLLWPDASPRAAQQPGQPLTATLRAAVGADRPAVAAPHASPVKASYETTTVSRQAVVAMAEPVPLRRWTAPENTGTHESSGAGRAAAAEPHAYGSGPVNLEPVAQAGEPVRPDADGIRAYRIGLAREARAYRQYPSLARERGWTGTVEVRVDVSPDGLPRQILLARSSGHDILDREAVNMMSRAATAAVLPDSLRGRAFAVRLPVVFDIADAQ